MEIEKIQKEQKLIVDVLESPSHGLLCISPRVGKTKIAIDIIKKEKSKRILWVTPSTKLRDIDIPAEFKLWKALTYLKRTDIICYASLENHVGDYDKIILDEYQDVTVANMSPIFKGKIKFKTILGLSGTHPQHEEKLMIYEKLNLKKLIDMSIDEAVEKGLVAPYRIEAIACELNDRDLDQKAGNATKSFMQTELAKYEYMTSNIAYRLDRGLVVPKFFYLNRMRFIYDLKSKNSFAKKFVSKLKGRTLVFTGGIKQAESICKNTYHSKTDDKDLQLFLDGKIDTLACVNAGGVGFTYRGVDNFVIVQVNSNKKGDATQKIARSLVLQEGYIANIYVLYVKDTVDEVWKESALKDFNAENVTHVSYKKYE